jgi:hypothetical protein
MSFAISILVALLIAAAVGTVGTMYFWTMRRRTDEISFGVRALSAMRWREFSHFVLDAMRHRGFDILPSGDDAERGGQQKTEFLLARDGERAMLSCKHGSAYRLTKQSVSEFAAAMKFQGAQSGVLVTPGTVDNEARRYAEDARIELVDGKVLWPEIAPLLPQTLIEDVRKEAEQRARRQIMLTWAAAVVAGLAVGLLTMQMLPDGASAEVTVSTPTGAAAPASTPRVAASPAPSAPVGISDPSTSVAAATPEEEDRQRVEVVRLVSTLPGVERAQWTTKSTLLVNVDESSTQRFDEICTVLTHYANLRTSRVHLQPPTDSQQLVRFKQCTTY